LSSIQNAEEEEGEESEEVCMFVCIYTHHVPPPVVGGVATAFPEVCSCVIDHSCIVLLNLRTVSSRMGRMRRRRMRRRRRARR
jgi:hypothetical protein